MCLAVPARIIEISGNTAVMEVDGVRRSANLSLVREPKVGDYVIVHAGFAIQKWSESDVQEWREIMDEMESLGEENH